MSTGQEKRSSQDVRYIAEWITKQHRDERGEWNPDRDERSCSSHATLDEAKAAAVTGAKTAGVTEWCRVEESTFNRSLGIPRRSDAAWDTARVWHGDWEGNWDEDTW